MPGCSRFDIESSSDRRYRCGYTLPGNYDCRWCNDNACCKGRRRYICVVADYRIVNTYIQGYQCHIEYQPGIYSTNCTYCRMYRCGYRACYRAVDYRSDTVFCTYRIYS